MPDYEISLLIIDKMEKKKYRDYNVLSKTSICKNDEELKCYLLYYKKLDNKCGKCGIGPKWNNKPLDFVIVRKNKDKNDNTLENLKFECPNCYYQNNKKSVYEDIKKSKMGLCVDCNRRFRKKKINTSLNPRNDIIEEQVKFKFTRMRCNFCLQNKITGNDTNETKKNVINNNIVITI